MGVVAERLAHDAYYTPVDLAEAIVGALGVLPGQSALEPSCGGGAFVRALQARGLAVDGVDVDPGAPGLREVRQGLVGDFALVDLASIAPPAGRWDWAVTNPPFSAIDAHLARCFALADAVALVARVTWLGARERAGDIDAMRPDRVLLPAPRPSFLSGGASDQAPVVVLIWYRVGSPAALTRWETLLWRDVKGQGRALPLQDARLTWDARGRR